MAALKKGLESGDSSPSSCRLPRTGNRPAGLSGRRTAAYFIWAIDSKVQA